MKVLIIGLGSIATKHLWALKEMDAECEVFALRSGKSSRDVSGVNNIHSFDETPADIDFIIICNPTSEHYSVIEQCISYGVPLFIEKPPLMNLNGVDALLDKIKTKGIKTYTAFNFRFHPLILWLKSSLSGKRVLEVQAYCGSYLPDWRPNRDYRKVYSAIEELGGGVHLDLIHEMDYITWLLGTPKKVQSTRKKISDLEIQTPDFAHYLLEYDQSFAAITLNYFRKDSKRIIEVVMDDDTWVANLLTGKITNSTNELVFESDVPVQNTYLEQMRYFVQNLKEEKDYMNNLAAGVRTLELSLGMVKGER